MVLKVVKYDKGEWLSINSICRLKYELNKTTVPNEGDGPLAAFEEMKYIRLFVHGGTDDIYGVFSCDAEPVDIIEEYALWHNVSTMKLKDLPEGTVLCSSITPRRFLGEVNGLLLVA